MRRELWMEMVKKKEERNGLEEKTLVLLARALAHTHTHIHQMGSGITLNVDENSQRR